MWLSKLKISHDDCPIVNRCRKYGLIVLSYPSTWYEEKGRKFATTTCYFQGGEELKKKMFLSDLKADRRITQLEASGDVFSYEIRLEGSGEHVMLYHTKQIIFIKPVVNHPDGHEYWEVASWRRPELEKFIAALKEHMDICTILRLESSPLRDVYFPNVMPKLSVNQRKALEIAYNNDYYSYPRSATLETLAKLAGVGVSTFQEHLRKAELKLLPVLIEQQLGRGSLPKRSG